MNNDIEKLREQYLNLFEEGFSKFPMSYRKISLLSYLKKKVMSYPGLRNPIGTPFMYNDSDRRKKYRSDFDKLLNFITNNEYSSNTEELVSIYMNPDDSMLAQYIITFMNTLNDRGLKIQLQII